MDISLTPELEAYINGKVQSGLYHSASEVIREGLELLRKNDKVHRRKLQALRREIQLGIDHLEQGRCSPFTEQTLEEIRCEGRQRLADERESKKRS